MEQQNNHVIIIGGGASIKEGINFGLWDKIKGKNIWSLNYAYMTMPYLPQREVFVDNHFFSSKIDDLSKLANAGVEIVAKETNKNKNLPKLKTYSHTRDISNYVGDKGIEENKIFIGSQGFCGTFALQLAICEKYKNIFILGYDYGATKNNIDSKTTHYYQDTLKTGSYGVGKLSPYHEADNSINKIVKEYEVFNTKNNSKIYNVSLESNIACFEKISYNDFFKVIENV